MQKFRCFLALACILTAVPVFADSDLTLFGAAQHQGKLTLQSATSTASTVSNFDPKTFGRSEEHTSELQSHHDLVCRLLLEKKKKIKLCWQLRQPYRGAFQAGQDVSNGSGKG